MKKRKGWTMMEIMMGIVCIIIMGAAMMPRTGGFVNLGKISAAKSGVSVVCSAVSQYKFEIGSYPTSLSALTTTNGAYGPWLNSDALTDPYGQSYQYAFNETNETFAVWSTGQNKVNNTTGGGTTVPSSFGGDDIGITLK